MIKMCKLTVTFYKIKQILISFNLKWSCDICQRVIIIRLTLIAKQGSLKFESATGNILIYFDTQIRQVIRLVL